MAFDLCFVRRVCNCVSKRSELKRKFFVCRTQCNNKCHLDELRERAVVVFFIVDSSEEEKSSKSNQFIQIKHQKMFQSEKRGSIAICFRSVVFVYISMNKSCWMHSVLRYFYYCTDYSLIKKKWAPGCKHIVFIWRVSQRSLFSFHSLVIIPISTQTPSDSQQFSRCYCCSFFILSRADLLAYVSLSLSAFIQRFVYLYSSLVLISIFAWCFLVLLLLLCAAHKFSGRRCVCVQLINMNASHYFRTFLLLGCCLFCPIFAFFAYFFFK